MTDVLARKNILIEKRCCFRCLRENHSSKNCRSNFRCFKCDKPHHISICDSFIENNKIDNNSKTGHLTAVTDISSKINQHVLLQTAWVKVKNNNPRFNYCLLLFDSCSQLSYITPSLCKKLNLKTIDSKEINIKTFGNNNTNQILDRVKVYVQGNDGVDIEIICFVKEICSPLNGQYIETACKNYNHLKYLKLADHHRDDEHLEVDILIGADYYRSIFENKIIRGFDGPIAIKSKVGYLVSGPIAVKNNDNVDCSVLSSRVLKAEAEFYNDKTFLKDKFSTVWNKSEDNISDNLVVEHFRKSIKFENNRYTVELPFKENHPLLCDNYNLCLKRFKSLEKKFLNDAKLFHSYNDIIKEQLLNGTIEQVLSHKSKVGLVHYLPHRPVIREDKATTKMRIVFDASATISGPSLNDCLHSGPSLTTLLNGVLIRFRVNKIAFIADIEKAFLNISISEKHRDFIRLLWYENINNLDIKNLKDHKLVTYRLCRVLFGATSSPFLLSAILISHAERYLSSDPIFVSRFLNSIHVDNLSFCTDSVIECFKFYEKCRSRLGQAGFNLRKFESNSVELDKLTNETNFQSQNLPKC